MDDRIAFATGAGAGALAMYLLDPSAGNRRRSMARDKLAHAGRDLSQRAKDAAVGLRSRMTHDHVSDEMLVERVRGSFSRLTSHPQAIDVTAHDGSVRLHGPILQREAKRVLAGVRRVQGVRRVEDRLERHKTADHIPALQGDASRSVGRSELRQQHWSPAMRLLLGGAGAALFTYAAAQRDRTAPFIGLLGLGLVGRASTNLEFVRLAGLGRGRRAVDLRKTIHVDAPVSDVFALWTDLEQFPTFMSHVRDVRESGGRGEWHWVVNGPAGVPVEFDSVLTDFAPNRVVAWKTVEGSPVPHAGIVRFDQERDGRTRVQVHISYNPRGGAIGHAVLTWAGADLKSNLDDDLLRMKTLVETGRPPHEAAKPSPRDFHEPRTVH